MTKENNWYHTTAADEVQAVIIEENTGKNIAVAYNPNNANLIAAAPELLYALNNLLNLSYDTARPTKSEKHVAIDLAIAAIRKATTNA